MVNAQRTGLDEEGNSSHYKYLDEGDTMAQSEWRGSQTSRSPESKRPGMW